MRHNPGYGIMAELMQGGPMPVDGLEIGLGPRDLDEGDLEKFLWLAVAGIFGVNSTESEGEQTGIIREQIRRG